MFLNINKNGTEGTIVIVLQQSHQNIIKHEKDIFICLIDFIFLWIYAPETIKEIYKFITV